MLGEPLSMLVPQVVGFRAHGRLPEGATATDLVLTVTQMLRKTGVVGKFVEYFGDGLAGLPLADRATIGNMSPEYGATCGFFPVDDQTLELPPPHRPRATSASRSSRRTARRTCSGTSPARRRPTRRSSSSTSATVEPSLAGPRRPQDRVPLARAKKSFLDGARHVRRRRTDERERRQGGRGHVPGQRPDDRAGARRPARARADATPVAHRRHRPSAASRSTARTVRARPRQRRDRGDHVLHEHVEPAGDDRRRPAREEGGRARPRAQAVGEVVPRARLEGRHRVLRAAPA